MKIEKELSIKELESLGIEYSYEIVKRRREIEELEGKIEFIRSEIDKIINKDKTPKLKITPF